MSPFAGGNPNRYPNGRELMTRAIEMGADVVGGIPHYENTRDKGVSSVMFLMDLAQRYGRLVDVHCDEIDDPQSRFLEVLAEEARVRGMGAQVTASHTCAMGSYDKRLLLEAVSPAESLGHQLHLLPDRKHSSAGPV